MTRINKMVCHGFKSFAKRTELVFDGKFSCILGPNGSGKSNVLDALCFVLGKSSSKSLRAEKASNLIYNGGKMKNPAKWGEVSIYFDNQSKVFPSDLPEIKVTRIVQQNGQSKYKINDETRTRQQIVDLLGLAKINPEGYNIILQGDIVHFVEMPPKERRELIDEISGISVYEEKKHKALLELQKVDERLKEAEIVLAERGTYLKELKKDRDQALKYKEMNDNIKVNKASYLKLKIDRREKIKESLDKKIAEHKQKIDSIQEKVAKLKQENEAHRQEIEELAKEVEKSGQGSHDGIGKQIEGLKIEHTKKSSRIESLKNEIKKITLRKQELESGLDDVKSKIKELRTKKDELLESKEAEEKTKKEIEEKVKKFREKHHLDSAGDIELDIENLDKKIEEQQKEIMALRESQQNLFREKDRVEYQANMYNDNLKKMAEIEKENKQQLDELKQKRDEFKKITLDLNKKLNEDSFMAAKIADKRKVVMSNVEELSKLEAKNMSIKAHAAVNIAIQKINDLKSQNQITGVYGTISELGNAGSKYSTALEVAAGPKINSIVVEDDKVAASCIRYLKTNKLGTATFIPLNKIKGREPDDSVRKLEDAKGAHGFAIDLIEFEPKFKKAFSYVFENTLVVDNIDTARRIGIGSAKMVTLDGDVAEHSGAMQGGYRIKKKGSGFQEKELSGEIKRIEDSIAEINGGINSLGAARENNEKLISEYRLRKAELEGEIVKIEKSLHLKEGESSVESQAKDKLADELKIIDKNLDEITRSISKVNSGLAQNKIKKQDLKSKISQVRAPTLIAELNTFEQKKAEVTEALININNEIKNAENEVNNIYGPEAEKIEKILKQHSKESEEFNEEIKTLQTELKAIDKDLKEKEEAASKFYKKFRELFSKRGKINEEISKNEMNIDKKQDESRQIEIDMNTFSLDLARTNAELAGFYEEFKQYHGIELKLNRTEEDYKAEIAKFERMVANIGSVNMRALEIYEDVEREFGKLNEKKDTLNNEKLKVEGMIKEIESRKKEIFMHSYKNVNDHFKKIFSELSTKGEANLELENEENPFEGGINIKVKIATNKFLDIKSLSGGEKTLTALAFIFSIQEHDPASFYVLDEVDAALDKRNADKLAKLVKKYSENAQYIIISHNDQVISEADTLYGVSMNEHGISKVVGLKV